jgi:hypothetical protein
MNAQGFLFKNRGWPLATLFFCPYLRNSESGMVFSNTGKTTTMKLRKSIFWTLLSATVLSLAIAACQKESSDSDGNGTTNLRVRLTDAPLAVQEVNVDITDVKVNFRNDSSGWTSLATNAAIYNLLGLQNGVDTLLAVGVVPTDTLKEIRLILGSNNTIMVDNVVYPLTIPSGSESGLKIKVGKKLNGTLDSLVIDFDAALSIHQTGNGTYMLKPVLKIK